MFVCLISDFSTIAYLSLEFAQEGVFSKERKQTNKNAINFTVGMTLTFSGKVIDIEEAFWTHGMICPPHANQFSYQFRPCI